MAVPTISGGEEPQAVQLEEQAVELERGQGEVYQVDPWRSLGMYPSRRHRSGRGDDGDWWREGVRFLLRSFASSAMAFQLVPKKSIFPWLILDLIRIQSNVRFVMI